MGTIGSTVEFRVGEHLHGAPDRKRGGRAVKALPHQSGVRARAAELLGAVGVANPHPVERPVDEDIGDGEEHHRQDVRQERTARIRQLDRKLDCQQAEKRGEFDDGIQ